MRNASRVLLAVALAASLASAVAAQTGKVLVLTSLPVTYSIGSALAEGTSIDVRNVPPRPRPLAALTDYLVTRPEQFEQQFAAAQAVVTIGKLWPEDPLFTAARRWNIRVVDIDATKPWSTTLEGVSVAIDPKENVPWAEADGTQHRPSPYFWLSSANGARAAEIIAADFARLVPGERARIEANLDGFRRTLLDLKIEYDEKLASVADLRVFALAPEFVYLTSETGIYVDGAFFKPDNEWTGEDRARFTAYLKDHDVPVVIHKWEPAAPIAAAIKAGGARLVVLDLIDLGVVEGGALRADSYRTLMRSNLEALYTALNAAQ